MKKITNKHFLIGPGHTTGKERMGTYYKPSGFIDGIQIMSEDDGPFTIRLDGTRVEIGDTLLPIFRVKNEYYIIDFKSNKEAASLLKSDIYD